MQKIDLTRLLLIKGSAAAAAPKIGEAGIPGMPV